MQFNQLCFINESKETGRVQLLGMAHIPVHHDRSDISMTIIKHEKFDKLLIYGAETEMSVDAFTK